MFTLTDTVASLYPLVIEGFHRVDSGTSDQVQPPITDDFTFEMSGTVVPAARYADFLKRRAQAEYTTRHCVTNFRVVNSTESSATVGFIVTSYRLTPGTSDPLVAVADFLDEWVRSGGEWRQRSRVISPFATTGA